MPIQTATFAAQMKIRQGKRQWKGRVREGESDNKGETEKGKRSNGGKEPEMDYAQQR